MPNLNVTLAPGRDFFSKFLNRVFNFRGVEYLEYAKKSTRVIGFSAQGNDYIFHLQSVYRIKLSTIRANLPNFRSHRILADFILI